MRLVIRRGQPRFVVGLVLAWLVVATSFAVVPAGAQAAPTDDAVLVLRAADLSSGVITDSGANATDSSATLVGGSVSGDAIALTGGSSYIRVPDSVDTDLASEFTLAYLGEWDGTPGDWGRLLDKKGNASEGYRFIFGSASDNPMGSVLIAPGASPHMVVTSPVGDGLFQVLDPWDGTTYLVDADWIGTFVGGGTLLP